MWVLLKAEIFSPLDKDDFDNTAVHHAAAGGNAQIVETFMAQGVPCDLKNKRMHTPLDQCTETSCKELLKA